MPNAITISGLSASGTEVDISGYTVSSGMGTSDRYKLPPFNMVSGLTGNFQTQLNTKISEAFGNPLSIRIFS